MRRIQRFEVEPQSCRPCVDRQSSLIDQSRIALAARGQAACAIFPIACQAEARLHNIVETQTCLSTRSIVIPAFRRLFTLTKYPDRRTVIGNFWFIP